MKVFFPGQQNLACISLRKHCFLLAIGRAICGQHGEPAGSGAIAESLWSIAPNTGPLFLLGFSWLNPLVSDFCPYPQPTPTSAEARDLALNHARAPMIASAYS